MNTFRSVIGDASVVASRAAHAVGSGVVTVAGGNGYDPERFWTL